MNEVAASVSSINGGPLRSSRRPEPRQPRDEEPIAASTTETHEAAKWFRLAADQGHASSQNWLGVFSEGEQAEPQRPKHQPNRDEHHRPGHNGPGQPP